MTPRDVLSEAVTTCKALTARYLAGFDDATRTGQAPNLPNHVAWSLGHCALTMHRVAEKADAKPPPPTDFAGPGGPVTAFNTEAIAFGSRPSADETAYPSLPRCVEIFNAACDRLAATVRTASDAQLNQSIPWGPIQAPWWSLVLRMTFHNGFHTGQIADLRRTFGFKSIFG